MKFKLQINVFTGKRDIIDVHCWDKATRAILLSGEIIYFSVLTEGMKCLSSLVFRFVVLKDKGGWGVFVCFWADFITISIISRGSVRYG